jgi:Raf kinase inhibitor-like YbhB/YbcL family protein
MTSSSFALEAEMPSRFTCDGTEVSPPLAWSGVPPGTQSLALVVDDPDAPDDSGPTKVHWIVYGLPPTLTSVGEGVAPSLPARQGVNDWRAQTYRGPCPTTRHRYFFKLYALDAAVPSLPPPDKTTLERAMGGHILAQTSLIGTYERKAGRP